jgi:hypothetical protein
MKETTMQVLEMNATNFARGNVLRPQTYQNYSYYVL